jgi:predicted DNA-binding ribbon-helix-helix protein
MNNSDNMYIKPITTPEHPDPTEALRYVDDEDGFYGYDYVCLEDATWHALCEIAHERGCTAGQLCSDIDLNFAPGEPFAPAARRYVARYLADIPANIELPGNFCVLTELLAAHRHVLAGGIDQPARSPETSLHDR